MSSLAVSGLLAEPGYCHWTCFALLAHVVWDYTLVRKGIAPICLPSWLAPLGSPSFAEQLILAVSRQLKLEIFFYTSFKSYNDTDLCKFLL